MHADSNTNITRSSTKIAAIIQARMGSTRLPGKMMMDLCGYPVLRWVIERCKMATKLDEVIIATTSHSEDDSLAKLAIDLGIGVFRGSREDVLDRFVKAARYYQATVIVRICADNPLVAPEEIDRLVNFYISEFPDYAFNHIPKLGNNCPDGLGAEIFSAEILERLGHTAIERIYREHVTLYLWEKYNSFAIKTLPCLRSYNRPTIKLDIDTKTDLQRMRKLCSMLTFQSKPGEIVKAWDLLGLD